MSSNIKELLQERIEVLKQQVSDPQDGSIALAEYMSDISESYWCASWLHDLEFRLWGEVIEGPTRLAAHEVLNLAAMALNYGVWYKWADVKPIWREKVSLEQWHEEYLRYVGKEIT